MRKVNAILTGAIMILFLIHMVAGILILLGWMAGGAVILSWISHLMEGLIAVHAVIGVKLTADSLLACKKAGVSYFKENKVFWARRISGFLIMVLIFFHIFAFTGVSADHYRLPNFDLFKLITQILLVLSIAFHIITNTKPLLIACGIKKLKPKVNDIVFWASILLLFMAVAFIIYYIRWSAI